MNDELRASHLAVVVAIAVLFSCSAAVAWVASAGPSIDQMVRIGDDGNPVFGCLKKVSGDGGAPIWSISGYDYLPNGPVGLDAAGNCISAVTLGVGAFLIKVNGATGVTEWTLPDPRFNQRIDVTSIQADSTDNIVTSWGDPSKWSATGAEIWRFHALSGRLCCSSQIALDRDDDVFALRPGDVGKARGSDGVALWTTPHGLDQDGAGSALLALTPTGDVVVAGLLQSSGNFAILKLSGSSGQEIWRREFAPPDVLAHPFQYAFPETSWTQGALVVDTVGNVAAVGLLLSPLGGTDGFAVKLTSYGDEAWRSIVASNPGQNDTAYDAAFDAAGNLFVAGGIGGQAATWKLDGSSGAVSWSTPLPPESAAVHVVVDRFGNPVITVGGAGVKLRGANGTSYFRVCGNGILEAGETCDDANTNPGDGCSDLCELESSSANGSSVVTTGSTATPAEPVQAEVTSPSGGAIEITRSAAAPSQPGFSMLGIVFDIQAPTETPQTPLVIRFLLEASLVPAGSLVVFKDGVAVDACMDTQTAEPDPCIADRAVQENGDVLITVLTSTASEWTFGVDANATCGNGVIDIGEQCDDGNADDGDCCTSSCRLAILPTSSCAPALSAKALIKIKKDPLGRRNTLSWKWTSAAAFDIAELGDPHTTTPLALCVYDANGLVLGAHASAGGTCAGRPCWQINVSKGKALYADKELTPDGVKKLLGKSGVAGKGRLIVKGKGPLLATPASQLALPVRAVLTRRDGIAGCWEATFSLPDNVKKNDGTYFSAKSD